MCIKRGAWEWHRSCGFSLTFALRSSRSLYSISGTEPSTLLYLRFGSCTYDATQTVVMVHQLHVTTYLAINMLPSKKTLLTTLILGASTTVLADGAAIAAAVSVIQNATVSLGSTVSSWEGNLLGAVPIVADSTALLGTIHDGTRAVRASANLTDLEALTVGLAVLQLVTDVNATLAALVEAKPRFDRALLTGAVLVNLGLEKSASNEFSGALVPRLPTSFMSTGEALAGEIEASFDEAIDVYSFGVL